MKMKKVTTRKPWTEQDVHALCALYALYFDCQTKGESVVKKTRNLALAESQGRSLGSVECKMMNVSAVLQMHGRPWVKGYKPLPNINRALIEQVCDYFGMQAKAA